MRGKRAAVICIVLAAATALLALCGCGKTSYAKTPVEGLDGVTEFAVFDGALYAVRDRGGVSYGGGEVKSLYMGPGDSYIISMDVSARGIWFLEQLFDEPQRIRLALLDFDGAELYSKTVGELYTEKESEIAGLESRYKLTPVELRAEGDTCYIRIDQETGGAIAMFDAETQAVTDYLEYEGAAFLRRNADGVYLCRRGDEDDGPATLEPVEETGKAVYTVPAGSSGVYDADGEEAFYYLLEDVVYSLSPDGEAEELFSLAEQDFTLELPQTLALFGEGYALLDNDEVFLLRK